jgi:carbamoyltransferase
LAAPSKPGVRDFINSKIKFREDFRPFAPSVLRNEVSRCFEYEGESPYMILVAKVRPEWKERLINVVHRDDSCRIQTVTESNGRYYELLTKYHELTDIPVLLNTSFNRRGMPIVETPADAISFFYESALDALVIGDKIIVKR